VIWEGENTYPGAIDLFTFAVTGRSGTAYKLVGSCVNDAIVVCAIAGSGVSISLKPLGMP
jgi:hypothetical protein